MAPQQRNTVRRCTLKGDEGGLATAELSENAKEFIRRHIHSVWQLELLLFFKKSSTGTSIVEASRALYMEVRTLEAGVRSFVNAGILRRDGAKQFKFAPPSSTSGAIEEIATIFSERRTTLINFIYSARVHSSSEAFTISAETED